MSLIHTLLGVFLPCVIVGWGLHRQNRLVKELRVLTNELGSALPSLSSPPAAGPYRTLPEFRPVPDPPDQYDHERSPRPHCWHQPDPVLDVLDIQIAALRDELKDLASDPEAFIQDDVSRLAELVNQRAKRCAVIDLGNSKLDLS